MGEWKAYRKTGMINARPYIQGESLEGVSVSDRDNPREGGWIACNPNDHLDCWFINKKFFEENSNNEKIWTWSLPNV